MSNVKAFAIQDGRPNALHYIHPYGPHIDEIKKKEKEIDRSAEERKQDKESEKTDRQKEKTNDKQRSVVSIDMNRKQLAQYSLKNVPGQLRRCNSHDLTITDSTFITLCHELIHTRTNRQTDTHTDTFAHT